MGDLDLDQIFSHGEKQVYAKIVHFIWKDSKLYRNMFTSIGGLHELCDRQKAICKRDALGGYQKWVLDAKTIPPGSSDVVVEGRQYYRYMRINKKMFCALVQYRGEELTNNYNDIDIFTSLFINLRRKSSKENLDFILVIRNFKIFSEKF